MILNQGRVHLEAQLSFVCYCQGYITMSSSWHKQKEALSESSWHKQKEALSESSDLPYIFVVKQGARRSKTPPKKTPV